MEYVIVLLLLYLIFKDQIRFKIKENTTEIDEVADSEAKRRKEEFDKLMSYSVDKAIESKRGAK